MPNAQEVSLGLVAAGQKRPDAQVAVLVAAKTETGPSLLGSGLDAERTGALNTLLPDLGFTGAAESAVFVPGQDGDPADVLLVVGLGETVDAPTPEQLRRAAGVGARALAGRETAVFVFPADDEAAVAAIAEGASLGAYAHTTHKSVVPATSLPLQQIVVSTSLKPGKQLTAVLTRAAAVARHAKAVRELVDTPANELYPESFVDYVKQAAKGLDVKVTVWDEKKLEAEGFGGILGVGCGSHRPPRLVKVEYSPRSAKKQLALVGKGITFDTGGISLKPPASMEEMKSDMAGAATVLHSTLAAAEIGVSAGVTAWLCLAENMPGGGATRPGDVLKMYNGKTVEVTNTDAEGRLVMADGLSKASEAEPDLLYDIATLTGAQVVALGARTAGLMGDDDAVKAVQDACKVTAEPFWAMPFPEEIRADLDSATADLRNSGNRNGGMLKAGIFLSEFVASDAGRAKAWGHLDVAGPAFNSAAAWGFTPKEGTGFGLRTLVEVAESLGDR